ncbi:MAG: glycosyltransferase family 2 protein [Acidimicrobiaceae bacterium]|nr:glycosyltransferase family 2 protein [Acidimicrobiaceae bacterium]
MNRCSSKIYAMPFSCQPRFSVVIPALNEASYLATTLASLSCQDFSGDYEVIVVDNNSTDNTAYIAEAHGVRVVSEPRPGICQARQTGTENSRGEIVVSTDADTTFPTSWLSGIDKAFSADPSCVAVAGSCRFSNAPWWGTIYSSVLFSAVYFIALVTGRVLYVTATNFSFKKTAWGGYDTRLTQGGDELDLLRRLRRRGKVIFLRDNPTMTSARRLQRGLFYNLFVTFFYYYALAYLLNRLFRRTLMHTAPAFRTERKSPRAYLKIWPGAYGAGMWGICILLAIFATPIGRDLAEGFEATFTVLRRDLFLPV